MQDFPTVCLLHPWADTASSCPGTALLAEVVFVFLYPHLHSPQGHHMGDRRSWGALSGPFHSTKQHRALVSSLRSCRRGFVSAGSLPSAQWLAAPASAGPGTPGNSEERQQPQRLLRLAGRSQSCLHSQGNSPKHQHCKTGQVPLAKSRCFHHTCGQGELASLEGFALPGFAMASKSRGAGAGSNGHSEGQQCCGPCRVSGHQGAVPGLF